MALQVSFPFGRLVNVFVTHVDESGGSFFVQVIDQDADQLSVLMEEIEQSVNDGTSQVVRPNDIFVGGIYLAEFEDGVWYRARVLGSNDAQCEVFFVDYGNSDFISLHKIRKAKDHFLKLSPQAFECELNQLETMASIKNDILEKELFCRAVSMKKNGTIVVDLFTDAGGKTNILDTIAGAGHRTSSSTAASQSTTRKDLKYKSVSIKLDSYQDVVVSHYDDPEHFCCQLISHTEDLQTLMSDLTDQYSELSSDTLALKSCSLGRACCAKFAEDGGWYRAVITGVGSVASGFVEVRFVDYGNCQKTPLTDVKEIKEELVDLPAQAFDCSLSGVIPSEDQWSTEASTLFGKLTKEKHMVGFVGGQEADGRYKLKLYDTTSDSDLEIPDVLVAAGYAQKTNDSTSPNVPSKEPLAANFNTFNVNQPVLSSVYSLEQLKPGSSERVLIPAGESPSKFYCQLFRTSQKLEDLMRDVEKHYSRIRGDEGIISSPAIGDPCCAKFSEDNCWYRAEVTSVDVSGKIVVQFVDYGNSEVVAKSNIRQLLPKFSELPRQAIECCLNKIRPKSQAWSSSDIKKFNDLAVEKEGMIEVVAIENNGKHRVELTRHTKAGNVNISEQLVAVNAAVLVQGAMATMENLENMQNKEFTEATVVIGNYEDVVVSYFEDPHNFWCQNLSSSSELDALMEAIDQFYSDPVHKNVVRSPFLGMSCVASYSVDNGWYRGKVTGIKKGNQVEVQFVDYGNSEVMPLANIRDITCEFMQLPAQAFKCALESIMFDGMTWPQAVLDKFNELTTEKELVGRVDAFDKKRGSFLILLLDTSQGKNLSIGDEITVLLPQNSKPVIEDLKFKNGDKETIVVTSVSGPSRFFCQVQKRAQELDDMMLDIDEHYQALGEQESSVNQPVIGGFYMAKYSVDQAWFRAKVTKVSNGSVEVYYVDYGNSESLPFSEIKHIAAKFVALPAQCVECTLAGDLQDISCEVFKEKALDMEFEARVVSINSNGVPVVELFSEDTNESLLNKLPRSAEKKPVPASKFQSIQVPSLDLTLNTKEDVYVTSVESTDKIFCQLSKNSSELDSIMDQIDEYYRPLGQQQGCLTSPSVGDFCVAKFSADDGWYRAQISSLAGSSAQVFYIDYGNAETVPLADVKVLRPEFAALPAQALFCSLAGCKPSTTDNTKLQEIALENEFVVNIVSLKANKAEVELLTKDSNTSVVSMLQSEVSSSEVFVPMNVANLQVQPGTKEFATITAFDSMTKFYCQLTKNAEALDQMMNEIDEHYSALKEDEGCIQSPSVGTFCIATFSEDGGWYRARITNVGSGISVFYIDYGNSESVSVKSIKCLLPQFTNLPAQAVECSMKGASSQMEILEKEFEIHFLAVEKNGSMEVNLISSDTKESVQPVSESVETIKGFKPLPGLFVDEYVDVCAVTVDGPYKFSCQVMNKEQVDILRHLMDSIQAYYTAPESHQDVLESPKVGMPCCALFSEDGLWYRSIITAVRKDKMVDVTYVDYGNSDTVPLSNVRVLKEEFLNDPLQSILCSLVNVKPLHGTSWSEASVARFEALVLEKQLVAKIIKKVGNVMEVELFDTSDDNKDVNIGLQLIEENLATHQQSTEQQASVTAAPHELPKTTKLSQLKKVDVSDSETVYVTTVISPSKFYCQIEGIEVKLEPMMEELSTVYEGLAPEELTRPTWSSGDLCCAMYSEDTSWYRAVVEDVSAGETAYIRFIDYGNGETKQLTELKVMKENFTQFSPFAIECQLSGAQPLDGNNWSSEAGTKFEQLTAEKALTANFNNHVEPYEVELLDGSVKLLQKLQEAGVSPEQSKKTEQTVPVSPSSPSRSKTKKLDYNYFDLKIGEEKKAFITCVTTPGEFYCQLCDNSLELDKLMNDLNDYCSQLDATEGCLVSPVVGQPCVALFSEDSLWYRARVTRLSVNSVEVQFVDYGNTEVIKPKDLKTMEPKYMALPLQAIECSLDLSRKDWTEEQGAILEHMTKIEGVDGEKEVSITLIEQSQSRYGVKVLEGTTCISDNLLAQIAGSEGESSSGVILSEAAPSGFSEVQLNVGVEVEGYVSYTNSSQDFYIQLSETFPRLCQMMDDIEVEYSGGVDGLAVDNLKPGSTCVAKFADDGGWYRASIRKILSDTEVEVEFVDYGNCDTVPLENVKTVKSKFADLPKQAIHCKLSVVKESLSANADELFKNAVEEKSLTVAFTTCSDNVWSVTLRDGDFNISELLSDGAVAEKPLASDVFIIDFHSPDIVEGQKEKVYIAHVENPNEFYLQCVSSTAAIDDLTGALTEEYTKMPASECLLKSVDVGMSCCVQFSMDGQWYRAVVMKVSNGEAAVQFVDFGNGETVKIDQIKKLKKEYMSLPRQAIQCCLVEPKGGWSSTEATLFEEIANSEEEFTAKFERQFNNKWTVTLDKDEVSVIDMLQPKDVGTITTESVELNYPQLPPGQTMEVYISHINNPNDFSVQMSETAAVLDEVTSRIGELYPSLGPTDLLLEKCEVGSVCCVPFSEDNCFYRAVVKNILSDSQLEVEFVDFGNSDTVPLSSVKRLSPDIAKFPCQALKCGLEDIKINYTDEETAVIEALLDKPLQATFVKQEELKWMIQLEDEGKCINKCKELNPMSVTNQAETSASEDVAVDVGVRDFESIRVNEGQTVEAYLVHTNDPSSFHIQLAGLTADIDNIMADIERIYSNLGQTEESLDDVTINSPCCAKFEEDQQWYRAVIRNQPSDSLVEVEFVDYGNREVVALASMKCLKKELMKLPCQAVHCGMANMKKTEWTEDDISFFSNSLNDKPVTVSFVSQEEDKWLVQLYCEGSCINDHEQFKIGGDVPKIEDELEKEQKQGFVTGFYSEPVLGLREPVYLLSTEPDDTLWLQLAITEEELEALMASIADCQELDKLEFTDLKEGLTCLGMFTEDDRWYRACVFEYNNESVHVRYVDYGNSEWVPLDRLRVIKEEFLQLPMQSFQCKLDSVKKLDGDQLFELCDQKLLEVEVVSREPTKSCILKLFDPDSGKSINDLVGTCHDAPLVAESVSAVEPSTEEKLFNKLDFTVGDSLALFVTVVDSPSSFWCQLGDEENKLEELMGQIDDCYSKLQDGDFQLGLPSAGMMCCAQYTADDVWYRAFVQEVCDDGNVAVHFVDYGNDEHLPKTRVKKLLEQFQELPIQAVKCSLFDVEPVNGDCWTDEVNEKFHVLCSDKALIGKIIVDNNSVLEVELTNKEDETEPSINSQLISSGLARKPGRDKQVEVSTTETEVSSDLKYKLLNFCVGSKAKVIITSIVNPGEFWCQVTESGDELISLMEELEKYFVSSAADLIRPFVGLPCCAKFSEDNQCYRAIVTDVGATIEVRYVDFGNTARLSLSEIKVIEEKFLSLPVQAVRCSLHGASPSGDGSWPAGETEYFQGLVHEQEMQLTVTVVEDDKYVVTLSSAGGVDLATAMSGEVPTTMPLKEDGESHRVSDEQAVRENSDKLEPTDTSDIRLEPTESLSEKNSVELDNNLEKENGKEIIEDSMEQIQQTAEHAEDTVTAELADSLAKVENMDINKSAEVACDNEETESSGSEEFVEARQDSSEEMAGITADDASEQDNKIETTEFERQDNSGVNVNADELERNATAEVGGNEGDKIDVDEKLLVEVGQLIEKDGTSCLPASDEDDDEKYEDSEDIFLSDEALEALDRELDDKSSELLTAKNEEIAEDVCKKDFDGKILISDEKVSEVDTVDTCEDQTAQGLETEESDNISDNQIREQKESEEKVELVENVVDEAACGLKDEGDGISKEKVMQPSDVKTTESDKVTETDSLATGFEAEAVTKKNDDKQPDSTDDEFSKELMKTDSETKEISLEANETKEAYVLQGDAKPEVGIKCPADKISNTDDNLNSIEADHAENVPAADFKEPTSEEQDLAVDALSKSKEDSEKHLEGDIKESEMDERLAEITCHAAVDSITSEQSQHTVTPHDEKDDTDQRGCTTDETKVVETVTSEQIQHTVTLHDEKDDTDLRGCTTDETKVVETVTSEQIQHTVTPHDEKEDTNLRGCTTDETKVVETVTSEQIQHTVTPHDEKEDTNLRDCTTDETKAVETEKEDTELCGSFTDEATGTEVLPLIGDHDSIEDTIESEVPEEEKPAYSVQNGHAENEERDTEDDECSEHDRLLDDEVYITAVLGDGHFWSQFSSLTDLAGLSELQDTMNKHYCKEEKRELDLTWREGDLCAVHSIEEDQWYRAEVASVSTSPSTPSKKKTGFLSRLLTKKDQPPEPSAEGNCLVTLLDSGVQLAVPMKALQPLDTSFQDLPYQAKLCHLDDTCELTQQEADRLEELLSHRTFHAALGKGVENLLACQDVPLILFPSKGGSTTTGYKENKVEKPTDFVSKNLQSE